MTFSGTVQVVLEALDSSGDVYVAGSFTRHRDGFFSRILRLNSDGSVDSGFDVSLGGFDNTVRDMQFDSSGRLYIAGDFTTYNGTSTNRIVRVHTDGRLDSDFDTTGGAFDDDVLAFTFTTEGDLIVVGDFLAFETSSRQRIIRLNSDGSEDVSFNSSGGFDDTVLGVSNASDGTNDVYVAGRFTTYGGAARNYLLRLDPDGSVDTSFDMSGGGPNSLLTGLGVTSDGGAVYIRGNLTTFNGSARPLSARVFNDGTLDTTFAPNLPGFGGSTNSMTIVDDDLYIAYLALTPGITVYSRVLKIGLDGSFDTSFFSDFDSTSAPQTIHQSSNGFYLGGSFESYNNDNTSQLVRVESDGTKDTTFTTGFYGPALTVRDLSFVPDGSGSVFISGFFADYQNFSTQIARVDSAGNVDRDFATATIAPSNSVYELLALGDGDLYVGGVFLTYGGVGVGRLMRLDSDGALDTHFNRNTTLNGDVNALAFLSDGSGKLYAGGAFTTVETSSFSRIVRFESTGSIDTSFAIGAGANGDIEDIAISNDGSGDIYIVGSFGTYNGNSSSRVARLNSDGSLDTHFAIGTGLNNTADHISLALDGTGDIYISGSFTTYAGTARRYLVRINSDGSLDTDFSTASSSTSVPLHSSYDPVNKKLYIGGSFGSFNGTSVGRFAAVHTDGSLDTSFGSSLTYFSNGQTWISKVDTAGNVYVGGPWTSGYNQRAVQYFVRLNSNGAIN